MARLNGSQVVGVSNVSHPMFTGFKTSDITRRQSKPNDRARTLMAAGTGCY